MRNDVRDVRQRVTQQLRQPDPAVQAISELAHHTDSSLARGDSVRPSAMTGGVRWVRASDLLREGGTRLSALHAQRQTELVKGMRHGMSRIATRRHDAVAKPASLPMPDVFGDSLPTASSQAVGA